MNRSTTKHLIIVLHALAGIRATSQDNYEVLGLQVAVATIFLILPHILLCSFQFISVISGLSNRSWIGAFRWITSGK